MDWERNQRGPERLSDLKTPEILYTGTMLFRRSTPLGREIGGSNVSFLNMKFSPYRYRPPANAFDFQ